MRVQDTSALWWCQSTGKSFLQRQYCIPEAVTVNISAAMLWSEGRIPSCKALIEPPDTKLVYLNCRQDRGFAPFGCCKWPEIILLQHEKLLQFQNLRWSCIMLTHFLKNGHDFYSNHFLAHLNIIQLNRVCNQSPSYLSAIYAIFLYFVSQTTLIICSALIFPAKLNLYISSSRSKPRNLYTQCLPYVK